MKFKIFSILLSVLTLATLIFSGCNGNKTPETVYKLTYNNFFPATQYNSILAEQWIQEIETRTNGAVNITYYPGGTLASSAQA